MPALFCPYHSRMGHHINAVIGTRTTLAEIIRVVGSPDPTPLLFDLVIVPLDEARLDALSMSVEPAYEGFTYLKPAMARAIGRLASAGQALYIETDYFGGMGAQGAALIQDGALIWQRTQSNLRPEKQASWLSTLLRAPKKLFDKTPISEGLARLGVTASANEDEFDSVGLSRFRSLEALGLEVWDD